MFRLARVTRLCLLLAAIMVFSAPARAQDVVDRIVFGIARYNPDGEQSSDYRTSIHAELRLASLPVWKLHPWLGLELNENKSSFAGAGLETDIDLSDEWVLTLQSGMGYFDDGTQEKLNNLYPDTGFQFRSTAEIAYKFDRGGRLGISVSHTSNAGLREDNSGAEQVGIVGHVPVGVLFSGSNKAAD